MVLVIRDWRDAVKCVYCDEPGMRVSIDTPSIYVSSRLCDKHIVELNTLGLRLEADTLRANRKAMDEDSTLSRLGPEKALGIASSSTQRARNNLGVIDPDDYLRAEAPGQFDSPQ